MARFARQRGSTSNMVRVFIPDNTSTKGAGLTGLTSASTNLTIAYIRELDGTATTYTGANIEEQTTVGTFQAPSSSSKIRFKVVDATNFPGVYELQFHDSSTAFGTGDTSQSITINIYEATTTALKIGPNTTHIPLVAWNPQDGVRLGLTGLANAVPGAAGGLFIAGTNAPVTITGSGNALTLTSTAANGHGLSATGNGTGNGILGTSGAGATGTGIKGISASTDGNGIWGVGTGTGDGLRTDGGASADGDGIHAAKGGGVDIKGFVPNVWDEVNTGATHNIVNSTGRQLRQANLPFISTGTMQAGSAANTAVLAATEPATDNIYVNNLLVIDSGTGVGQTRFITDYVGSTTTAYVNRPWQVTPNNTSTYTIIAFGDAIGLDTEDAQGGGASTITLAASSSAVNDYYTGNIIALKTGVGAGGGQARIITAYNGTTKVATVDTAWATQPVSGTMYTIMPQGRAITEVLGTQAKTDVENSVWDAVLTGASHNNATSAGKRLRQISTSIISDGTAQSATSDTIVLAASEPATDNIYNDNLITITGGTGQGQTRIIGNYIGSSKTVQIMYPWEVTPNGTSTYSVRSFGNFDQVTRGNVQAATANTITLNAVASTVNDYYLGDAVMIVAGTGMGQCRIITGYVGSTQVVTVDTNWATQPDTTSEYCIHAGRAYTTVNTDKTGYSLSSPQTFNLTGNVTGNLTGSVGSVTSPVSLTAGQLFIKKNTQVTITFPMTDATTHAPKTLLAVTAKRSIDGGALGACANAVTELSDGLYKLILAAADVNGTFITLEFSAVGADTKFLGIVTQA